MHIKKEFHGENKEDSLADSPRVSSFYHQIGIQVGGFGLPFRILPFAFAALSVFGVWFRSFWYGYEPTRDML